MTKYAKIIVSAFYGLIVWLFWFLAFPQALGLQEQNQLFLWTWDYLGERLSLSGGLADWLSELLVQFYYIPWLGALLLAAVFVLVQRLTWRVADSLTPSADDFYAFSFIPSLLLLLHMGDHDVLLSYAVALVLALLVCLWYVRRPGRNALTLLLIPVIYWLAGPVVWVYVFFAIGARWIRDGRVTWALAAAAVALTAGVIILARYTLLRQYTPMAVIWGINYYRMPLQLPVLQVVTAASAVIVPLGFAFLPRLWKPVPGIVLSCLVFPLAAVGLPLSFDKDTYEIIAYDQLVRQEKWEEVVKRAEKYQPKSDVGCVNVNLSLFMCGRIEDMFDFYQCGTRGLLMPRVRDYISNVGTGEAFWRLGMVNSALRYAFDTQESTINNRKSGRAMMRIAECQIVNGRYKVASKYIDILKHSTFYRRWALEHEAMLDNEEVVLAAPVYKYLRAVKFEDDFLYYYDEMDKMLAILYNQNHSNIMAGYYFMAYKKLAEQGGEQ